MSVQLNQRLLSGGKHFELCVVFVILEVEAQKVARQLKSLDC